AAKNSLGLVVRAHEYLDLVADVLIAAIDSLIDVDRRGKRNQVIVCQSRPACRRVVLLQLSGDRRESCGRTDVDAQWNMVVRRILDQGHRTARRRPCRKTPAEESSRHRSR